MSEITHTIDVGNVAPFIPEIFSSIVIDEYVAHGVDQNLVDRRFEKDLKYGDQVNRGLISKVAPISRTVNSDMTYNTVAETWVNCTVNKDYYIFRKLEPLTKKQSMIDLLSEYAKMDAKALAEDVDEDVATLYESLNSGTNYGTLNVDVTDDDLLNCKVALDLNNVPFEDRAWVISPETWGSLMKIDKFVSLDYVNPQGSTASESAKLNRPIYGAPVYVSNNLEPNAGNHNCVFMQKESIMLIIQAEPIVVKAYDVRSGCDTLRTEMYWGKVVARNASGVCLQGK